MGQPRVVVKIMDLVAAEADFLVQHQAILDAVIDEDPDAAEAAMKVLLETAARASSTVRKRKL